MFFQNNPADILYFLQPPQGNECNSIIYFFLHNTSCRYTNDIFSILCIRVLDNLHTETEQSFIVKGCKIIMNMK